MPTTWKQIAQTEQYQALTDDQRGQVQNSYFNKVIAPKAPKQHLTAVTEKFRQRVIEIDAELLGSVGLTNKDRGLALGQGFGQVASGAGYIAEHAIGGKFIDDVEPAEDGFFKNVISSDNDGIYRGDGDSSKAGPSGTGALMRIAGEQLKESGQTFVDYLEGKKSTGGKAIGNMSFVERDEEGDLALGPAATNIGAIENTIYQSIPAMLPGVAAAKYANTAKGAMAAGGLAEGVVAGSMTGVDSEKAIMEAPQEEIEQSPFYQEQVASGQSPDQARVALATAISGESALKAGAVTALLGAPFSAYLNKLFKGLQPGGRIKETVKSGVMEGVTEAAQSTAEDLAAQQTRKDYTGKEIDSTQTLNATVGGTFAGTAMGTGVGLISPKQKTSLEGGEGARLVDEAQESQAPEASAEASVAQQFDNYLVNAQGYVVDLGTNQVAGVQTKEGVQWYDNVDGIPEINPAVEEISEGLFVNRATPEQAPFEGMEPVYQEGDVVGYSIPASSQEQAAVEPIPEVNTAPMEGGTTAQEDAQMAEQETFQSYSDLVTENYQQDELNPDQLVMQESLDSEKYLEFDDGMIFGKEAGEQVGQRNLETGDITWLQEDKYEPEAEYEERYLDDINTQAMEVGVPEDQLASIGVQYEDDLVNATTEIQRLIDERNNDGQVQQGVRVSEAQESEQTETGSVRAIESEPAAAEPEPDQPRVESQQEKSTSEPGTEPKPLTQPTSEEITNKANAAATSNQNELPEPTQAQKEAGNYKKGEPFTLHGQRIVIENPKDSERKGEDPDGKEWSNTMGAHYGDIKLTEGGDGDPLDVFVGEQPESTDVYVIDQYNQDGTFDEHKIMMGFTDQGSAEKAYLDSYDKGWELGPVSVTDTAGLKSWIDGGETTVPFGGPKVKPKMAEAARLPIQSDQRQDSKRASLDKQKSTNTKNEVVVSNQAERKNSTPQGSELNIQGAKPPLVSLDRGGKSYGTSVKNVKKWTGKVALTWGMDAPSVVVVKNYKGLPVQAQQAIKDSQSLSDVELMPVRGYFDEANNSVYIIANNIPNKKAALKVLAHEARGHFAMEAITGENYPDLLVKVAFLEKVGDKTVAPIAKEIRQSYGELTEDQAAAEIIARLAERGVDKSKWSQALKRFWTKVTQAVKRWLKTMGFDVPFSVNDVEALLIEGDRYLKKGGLKDYTDNTERHRDSNGRFARAPDAAAKEEKGFIEQLSTIDGAKETLKNIEKAVLVTPDWPTIKDYVKKHSFDRPRKHWLGALSRRQVADVGSDVLPQIEDYIKVANRMEADRNELLIDAGRKTDDWRKWAGKNVKQAEEVAELMHDTTQAGVDPSLEYVPLTTKAETQKVINEIRRAAIGYAGDGSHRFIKRIKKHEAELALELNRLAAKDDLQARWDAMNPEQQELYTSVRDFYGDRFDATQTALENRIIRAVVDEKYRAALIRNVRKQFESLKVQAPYFPLVRHGDYWVRAIPKGKEKFNPDEIEFQMFQSPLKQKLWAAKMKRKGFEVKTGKNFEYMEDFGGASDGFVTDVIGVLDDKLGGPASEQLKDEIYQLYLKTVPDVSMRKSYIHRNKTKGFHKDALRSFAETTFHGSYQLARLRWSDQMEEQMKAMEEALTDGNALGKVKAQLEIAKQANIDAKDPELEKKLTYYKKRYLTTNDPVRRSETRALEAAKRVKDNPEAAQKAFKQLLKREKAGEMAGENSEKASDIYTEMKERHKWAMNPQGSALAANIGAVGFIFYLGLSPAAALVNTTQTPLVAYPVLGAKYGYDKAGKELIKAGIEFFAGGIKKGDGFSIAKKLKGTELEAYQWAVKTGIIDKTLAHDLASVGNQGLSYNPKWHKSMEFIAHLFHRAEVFNREITFIAAYRLARPKVGHVQALQDASNATWDSHFDYGSDNKARVMQGDIKKVAFMFRQFSLNMIYLLGRSAHQMVKGESKAVRDESRRKLAGIMGMHALVAGSVGLPIFWHVAKILELAFNAGDEDEPWEFEAEFKNFLSDHLPSKTVADSIVDGPITAMTGVDLSSRVSLNGLLLREPNRELEGRDTVSYWFEQLGGPVLGIGLNMGKGIGLMGEGKTYRGVEAMLPTGLKNLMKAYRYADEGALNLGDAPIVEDVEWPEVLSQAIGFSPHRINQQYDANSYISRTKDKLNKRRTNLINRIILAESVGDDEALNEAWNEASAFSEKNYQDAIRPKDVRRSRRRRQGYVDRAENGLLLGRRDRELRQRGRFAEE